MKPSLLNGSNTAVLPCVVPFAWEKVTSRERYYRFPLREGEVTLFDQYMLAASRGRGVVPCPRLRRYGELKRRGYEKFSSYSECSNTPTITFRHELNAKRLAVR